MALQYRLPVEETFSWQRPVLGIVNDPPTTPTKGMRYLVGETPTGDFIGHTNAIAWYNGTEWKFDVPVAGWCTYRSDIQMFNSFETEWGPLKSGFDGDMLKSVYDTDNNGIVDKAESIDDGVGNTASAVDIKDAVDKKHEHSNQATLDDIEEAFTTALKTAYDDAVTNSHTHINKSILDSVEEAFTTALKTDYDLAVERMGSYDAVLGCVLMSF